MPNPVIVFAFVIATMYGLSFHVVLGGNARRLVLFVVSSWVGFLLGQYIGGFLNISMLRIGVVHLLPASVAAVGLLIFARLLTAEPSAAATRR